MKLNTRTLAIAAALGIVAGANAEFRFFFAYGDQGSVDKATRNYNGSISDPTAALGKEIPSNVAFRVPKAGDGYSFKVQVWAEYVGSAAQSAGIAGYAGFVTYDKANGNANTTLANDSTLIDRKLTLADNTTVKNNITMSNAVVSNNTGSASSVGTDAELKYGFLGGVTRKTQGGGTAPRRVGVAVSAQALDTTGSANPGASHGFAAGEKIHLFDITMVSNLTAFETYTGLGVFTGTGTYTAPNARMGTTAGNTGVDLMVQAVPEPATMAAIAAGLAAFARRRKA